MAIAVRFLSGSLSGREFRIEKDVLRIGDAPEVDIRIDPTAPDNAGARDRVIEIFRDGNRFRIHSAGSREISAQGETSIDRRVVGGEEIRFGAWGPVFTVLAVGEVSAAAAVPEPPTAAMPILPDAAAAPPPAPTTSPITPPPAAENSFWRRRKKEAAPLTTESGEKPVGPKTVYMMIQDALGKARETQGGALERGTIFLREMVSETIQNATRSLKIGLALMAGALLILGAVLVYNIAVTRRSITEVKVEADKRVTGVKSELTAELVNLKAERDRLAVEGEALAKRLQEVEKTAGGSQQALAELRARLKAADEQRLELERKMTKAMAAAEADRRALGGDVDRLAKAEAERRRQDQERAAREKAAQEEAARAAAAAAETRALAPTAPPAQPTTK